MKNLKFINLFLVFVLVVLISSSCEEKKGDKAKGPQTAAGDFLIGWSSRNITPNKPVLLWGQMYVRVSEGIMDSLTVTALALESGSGPSSKKAIMISCDLIGIGAELLNVVRNRLKVSIPEFNPEQLILNATHTHTAPGYGSINDLKSSYGVDLPVMASSDCLKLISERIAEAAVEAWKNRKPGGISFGLGHAVVGHNRLKVDFSGKAAMYGKINSPDFSHMEGFEDHTVNLLYTWDKQNKMTGVVINVACPAQVTEEFFKVSADYWHNTRVEVRKRLGEDIFILQQCSSAGDQSPHVQIGTIAENRMQRIMGTDSTETGSFNIGRRKQIATQIADAVTSVLPYMKDNIDWNPIFDHQIETVQLPRRIIKESPVSISDYNNALKEAEGLQKQYDQLLLDLKNNPGSIEKPRWYSNITKVYSSMKSANRIVERYEMEKQPKKVADKEQATVPVELHVLRIGDVAMATNPFELYLDFGVRIKGRSPAIQTFLINLANGSNGYLAPARSTAGGAYGAAGAIVGPDGGQELVEKTLGHINSEWKIN
ncbi:MAG: hypothetical protein M0Q53_19935 [Prolixibacteraceae bacterium]|jgi:hypothetical protein|nr:hypothetical protein [Prolixibacteraceae bacterium]